MNLLSRIVVAKRFLTDGETLNSLSIEMIVFKRHVCLLGFECCVINFCFVPRNDVLKKFLSLIGKTCIIWYDELCKCRLASLAPSIHTQFSINWHNCAHYPEKCPGLRNVSQFIVSVFWDKGICTSCIVFQSVCAQASDCCRSSTSVL
jgi:hypothetical protein